jgi:hypothetical protein
LQQTQAAAMWQARAQMLGEQLEQTRDELRALQAPKEPELTPAANAANSVENSVQAAPAPLPTGEPARPWWRFW